MEKEPGQDKKGKNSLKHISRDSTDPLKRTHALFRGRLLQARLDRIDGGIAQGPHGAAHQANEGGLPAGEGGLALALAGAALPADQRLLEVRVGGEVDGLVAALAQGGEGDAAVEGADALLLDHGVGGVRRVAVLGDVERVRHAVVLGLQPDLDHLHGRDDRDGLRHARREPRHERPRPRHRPRLLVRQELLVRLERREADRHLRHDAGQDRAEPLVEPQGRLAPHDLAPRLQEPALWRAWLPRPS